MIYTTTRPPRFRIREGRQWAGPFWRRVLAGLWGITFRRTVAAEFTFYRPEQNTHIKLFGLAKLSLSRKPAHRDSTRLLALFRRDHVELRWYDYEGGVRQHYDTVPYGVPIDLEVPKRWRGPSLIAFAHANNGPSSPHAPCDIYFTARRLS
jgi:hypothetical protein